MHLQALPGKVLDQVQAPKVHLNLCIEHVQAPKLLKLKVCIFSRGAKQSTCIVKRACLLEDLCFGQGKACILSEQAIVKLNSIYFSSQPASVPTI